jgi:chemosensory pili system protein ChpC
MSAVLDELYGLLVPLAGSRLVLPRAAIIEVMGYAAPRERPDDAPEWLLGWTTWTGNRIPLISFEAASGQPLPEFKNRTRIAVVQAISGLLDPPAFAIATQGYPYLLRVNRNVLKLETGEAEPSVVLSRVRMANERPAVPDLEELERMIAGALGLEVKAPALEAVEVMPDNTQLGLGTNLGIVRSSGDEEIEMPAVDEALRFDDDSDEAIVAALDDVSLDATQDGAGSTPADDAAEPDFDQPAVEGIEVDEGDGK